jgi:anaerobic ribonucleoside-triphosphate reductase
MTAHTDDESIDPNLDTSREGLFDAQLSFAVPYVDAPQPLKTIIKRDGREVPFEKRKIADAIFKAALAAGEGDINEAESLASGVAIFLGKNVLGSPPNVDAVHDAVERVLIELGHAKTALAYARYRDKRSRIRKLREGDVRSFLTEFEEAQRERGEFTKPGEVSIYVRRGDERLDGWSRDKIVDALVRETELDRATANVIAMEVERQIVNARVESPTASLVRELVDAKLIEFGLEEFRRRHMRLGVPLYDAEQIICMPNQTVGQAPRDPAATDAMLAERVKKEFALTQVFSREVVDAHFAGDIYLHHLGKVDRLVRSTESLECVTRFGAASSFPYRMARPPADSDSLCVQLAQHSAQLVRHYAGGVSWDAVNIFAAPHVPNASDSSLEDFSFQMLAHIAAGNLPSVALGICPLMCAPYSEWDAIGPAGIPLSSPYNDFAHSAQRIAWSLLEAYQDGGPDAAIGTLPALNVELGDEFFQHPAQERFIAMAAETALKRGGVTFHYRRGAAAPCAEFSWQPSRIAVHDVTINLPRVAYSAESEDMLFSRLQHVLRIAVLAHVQKSALVARLMTWKDMGPLSLLSRDFDGQTYLDVRALRYCISVTGLNEFVQHVTGRQMHESFEAIDLAQRVASHLRACCDAFSDEYGLQLELTDCDDLAASSRLAMLDLQQFPDKARAVVKSSTNTHEVSYTPGIRIASVREVNPMQRLRLEGLLHEHVACAVSKITLPDPDISVDALAVFLRTAHHRTRCRRFTFVY